DAGDSVGLETGGFHLDCVSALRQRYEPIASVGVRRDGACETAVLIHQCHVGAGDGRGGRIFRDPGYFGVAGLRGGNARHENRQDAASLDQHISPSYTGVLWIIRLLTTMLI